MVKYLSAVMIPVLNVTLASVYRLPVKSPAATTKEVKARALDLDPILQDVQVKHPLVHLSFPNGKSRLT